MSDRFIPRFSPAFDSVDETEKTTISGTICFEESQLDFLKRQAAVGSHFSLRLPDDSWLEGVICEQTQRGAGFRILVDTQTRGQYAVNFVPDDPIVLTIQ